MSKMRWKHTRSYRLSELCGWVVVKFLEVNTIHRLLLRREKEKNNSL